MSSPPFAGHLARRVAVVTGAGSGLGRGIAIRFADEGARVVCVDINEGAAEETARIVESTGGEVRVVAADVADVDEMENVAATTLEQFGAIDVLAANAGIPGPGTAGSTTPQTWERVIGVNLTGVWASARAVLPTMLERGRGAIVATASLGGLVGVPNIAPYAAAKGGVIALVRQMAADYSASGIRVNALCPGTTPTPLVMASYASSGGMGQQGDDAEARLASAAARYPLGRLGNVEDVAAAALFLASDEASWITGVALPVDGGYSAL